MNSQVPVPPSCRWIPAWQNNRPRPKCRNLPSIVPWIPLIQRLTTMCRRTWGIPWAFFGIFLMIQGERHFRIDEFLQDKCYQLMAKRMVDHVLSGYFSCLFCYGQTGTGKTTTIMGKAGHMVGCGGVNKMLSPSSFQTPCLRKIEVLFKCGKHIRQFPANFPLPPTRKASLEPRFQSLTAFQNTNVLLLVAIKFGRRIGNHLSFQGD